MSTSPHKVMKGIVLVMLLLSLQSALTGPPTSSFISFLFAPLVAAYNIAVAGATVTSSVLAPMILPMIYAVIMGSIVLFTVTGARMMKREQDFSTRTFERDVPFSRHRKVSSISECLNCEKELCRGYATEYGVFDVVAGVRVRESVHGTLTECRACHEADSVERALRREREDPDEPEVPEAGS